MKIIKILGIISSIVLMLALATFFTIKDSKRTNRLHKEYKNFSNVDEYSGKVKELYIEKGACFATVGSKKLFLKVSANYLYPEVYLSHVISVGDSIVKQSGSDTIRVHKENMEYYFILGKFINKSQ